MLAYEYIKALPGFELLESKDKVDFRQFLQGKSIF